MEQLWRNSVVQFVLVEEDFFFQGNAEFGILGRRAICKKPPITAGSRGTVLGKRDGAIS